MWRMSIATVWIVDDNQEVLESLSWLIESVNYNVMAFDNPKDFLANYDDDNDNSGCLVLDVRMPEMCGIELQTILCERSYHVPIIFLTGHGDITMAVDAMKKGAFEFFTKPVRNQNLLGSINRAVKQDAENKKDFKKVTEILERVKTLTPREKEVMDHMVQGKLTKAIAQEIGISPKTVEVHRSKVLKKMQVSSLVKLINVMLKNPV